MIIYVILQIYLFSLLILSTRFYLPGFFVSLIATSIGVWFGFKLDRLAEDRRKLRDNKEKNRKLLEALKFINISLDYNRGNLDSLQKTLYRDKDNLKIILPLDISTWKQFGTVVNEVSPNYELQNLLSHFYMVAEYVVKLQSNYFNYAILPTPMGGRRRKKEILVDMREDLRDFTKELLQRIIELKIHIQYEQERIQKLK
jgi:hypothetical protein